MKNEKPALVITYTIKPNVYGGFACRLAKIPYAVNITGLGTAFENGGLLKKIVTVMNKAACKKAKVVFFENEGDRQIFIREKIVKEEQTHRLNGAGVNIEKYQVVDYPQGNKFKFLFMGRVMAEKGIDELFEAMRKIISDGISCELDVLGGYEENYKDKIEKYISAMILMNPHQIRETQNILSLPFFVQINQVALNKLLEIFAYENVCGITGNTINDNVKEIVALKDLCRENDIPIESFQAAYKWEDFKKNSDGMVPVVVQDYRTREVLMMAYMNEEAYEQTLKLGKMTYYSRSRQELWLKGLTSGHYQYVKELVADCDMDTILAKVSQIGAACHTGSKSCFFNEITKKDYEESSNPLQVFEEVFDVIKDRKVHPKEGSYTNYLFDKGIDKILKKLGEEATEIVIAAKNPNPNEVKYEISDFLYHMMVLMAEKDVTWEEITTELANR